MPQTDYGDFLTSKVLWVQVHGRECAPSDVHPMLFPFQRDLTAWAVRKGRAALFADTGLGKTFMQVEWARLVRVPTLILAPLAVARQTVREAAKLGITITYARSQAEADPDGITITNYEMMGAFDPSRFGAGVAVQQRRYGVSANASVSRWRVLPSSDLRMLDSSSTTASKSAALKRSSIS